jgi:hypothetical protein
LFDSLKLPIALRHMPDHRRAGASIPAVQADVLSAL